jgi:hypothetical protein
MVSYTRICFSYFLIVSLCVLYPDAVLSEPKEKLPIQSQEEQFLAQIRFRDRELAYIGEFKRITSFHENFKSRLERLLIDMSGIGTREQMTNAVNGEVARLQEFESKVMAAKDIKTKIALVREFDRAFPLSAAEVVRQSRPRVVESSGTDSQLSDPGQFTNRERVNASEVFQNVSTENREWRTHYDRLFISIDRSLAAIDVTLPHLDKLPGSIYELIGARSFNEMTGDQIKDAFDRYRSALTGALKDISSVQMQAVDAVRTSLIGQIDVLGTQLTRKSNEARAQFEGIEKGIVTTANSIFGRKVSENSFTYLLLVFTVVFLFIMIMPWFYPAGVAENVLRSDFLLQISTVFVLVAAIIILAIGELIARDQLPVLLAGISGYVLGQLGKDASIGRQREASGDKAVKSG